MEKENVEEKKSYRFRRFGMRFQVIHNGTTTTVILHARRETNEKPYVGLAVLHKPDKYDRELGVLIAMKSAMSKFHSDIAGDMSSELAGFQAQMRNFNDKLSQEVDLKRNPITK